MITVIGIFLLLIAISFAIVVYNYRITDVTRLSKPAIDIPDDRIKSTKVGMIYQTKVGGDEWFMDPSKLKNDKRFDANANLTRDQDGTWSVDSKEQTRRTI